MHIHAVAVVKFWSGTLRAGSQYIQCRASMHGANQSHQFDSCHLKLYYKLNIISIFLKCHVRCKVKLSRHNIARCPDRCTSLFKDFGGRLKASSFFCWATPPWLLCFSSGLVRPHLTSPYPTWRPEQALSLISRMFSSHWQPVLLEHKQSSTITTFAVRWVFHINMCCNRTTRMTQKAKKPVNAPCSRYVCVRAISNFSNHQKFRWNKVKQIRQYESNLHLSTWAGSDSKLMFFLESNVFLPQPC